VQSMNGIRRITCVCGKVIEGKDVVDKIGKTRTAAQDRPAKDITIKSVKIQKG